MVFILPLLLILLRFAAPAFRNLMEHSIKVQCQLGLIPTIYYGFDYLTRIYTDLLSDGSPVAVTFMPTVCCAAYLIFLLYNSAEERRHSLLQQMQDNLQIQVAQATREISDLREFRCLAGRAMGSVCSIHAFVTRYGGDCQFLLEAGRFILRLFF